MPQRARFAGGKGAVQYPFSKCSGCGVDSAFAPPDLASIAVLTMHVCVQSLCFQPGACTYMFEMSTAVMPSSPQLTLQKHCIVGLHVVDIG